MKDGAFAPQSWKFPGFCEWELKKEKKKILVKPLPVFDISCCRKQNSLELLQPGGEEISSCWSCIKDSIVPGFTAPRQAGGCPELGEHPDQWHLPQQDTSDRTMLQQISTFQTAELIQVLTIKYSLFTVRDNTSDISPWLLWYNNLIKIRSEQNPFCRNTKIC